ncbi:hypothetical protein BS78_04G135400 [Paspalum vaginatum]|nr:hypothetical protein BS78_04G135400 [Paspalum vaginatum]
MVPDICIPVELMEFEDVEDAFQLYKDYAELAGFDVRRYRKTKPSSWYVCNREGQPPKKEEAAQEPKTQKTSFRTGCRAEVRVKYSKEKNVWYFDNVYLDHNHKLQPEARMTTYMRAHKTRDEGIMNLLNIMSSSGVPHQVVVNVMAHLHGGRNNITFKEKDMRNSKADYARKDIENDAAKLLDQFNEWKNKNIEFY